MIHTSGAVCEGFCRSVDHPRGKTRVWVLGSFWELKKIHIKPFYHKEHFVSGGIPGLDNISMENSVLE
jgi:hypothetical protein